MSLLYIMLLNAPPTLLCSIFVLLKLKVDEVVFVGHTVLCFSVMNMIFE